MSNRDFYSGIITALNLLALHDQQTIYEELMQMLNEYDQQALMRYAKQENEYEWGAFEKYGFKLRKKGI